MDEETMKIAVDMCLGGLVCELTSSSSTAQQCWIFRSLSNLEPRT